MARRLLILRAGSGTGNSLIRSLKTGDPSLLVVGCHDDRFVLKNSPADRNYLIPRASRPEFPRALCQVIAAEHIDLVIPNSDADVRTISDIRDTLPCRIFLPRQAVIETCQDKYALTELLRNHGLPVPSTYPVANLAKIEELFGRLSSHTPLWCRSRTGTGSFAAIPVGTPEHAKSWINYWQEMRGAPEGSFTLSEYLPGRDIALQGLWKNGALILARMHERLSYMDSGSPSGVSSSPALAKMVMEPRIIELCLKAIGVVDPEASGAFMIDIKEDARGTPCITEVNAGRIVITSTMLDLAGNYNMAVTYVRLALCDPVEMREVCDFIEDCYVVRDHDELPGIFQARELYEGIDEARG